MSSKDPKGYYKLIGKSPSCDDNELKKAFNSATMAYHPDGPAGRKIKKLEEPERSKKLEELNEKMRRINEARDVLCDSEKRKAYDSGMFDPNTGQPFDMSGGMGGGGSVFDFFGDIFGQRGGQREQKVEDLHIKVNISLSDSYNGRQKKYKVNRTLRCKKCCGMGAPDSKICNTCSGKGRVMKRIQRGPFATIAEEICGTCRGQKTIKQGPLCNLCNGKGIVNVPEIVKVDLPKGTENGTQFCMESKGDESAEADILTGDLIFECCVSNEEKISFNKKTGKFFDKNKDLKNEEISICYERIGNDLFTDIEIDLPSFLAGGKSIVFLPNETRNIVNFNSLMNGNKLIVLSGKGFKGGDVILRHKIKASNNLYKKGLLMGNKSLNMSCSLNDLIEEVEPGVQSNSFNSILKDAKDIYKPKKKEQQNRQRGERSTSFQDLFGGSGSASFSFF